LISRRRRENELSAIILQLSAYTDWHPSLNTRLSSLSVAITQAFFAEN
jgi:hypothetical protein